MCECKIQYACVETLPTRDLFLSSMTKLDESNWAQLYMCDVCGQLWKVELGAYRGPDFAFKVLDQKDWIDINEEQMRNEFLIRKDGGLSEETCIYRGCNKKALKGTKVCVGHKYSYGT